MDELYKAIVALYKGSSGATLRGLAPGGMFLSTAPQQSVGVFIVFSSVAAPIEYAMASDSVKPATQNCDIQFTFSTLLGSASDVVAAANAFKTLYNFATLSISVYSSLVAKKISEQGPIRDDFTKGYATYHTYRFTIGN